MRLILMHHVYCARVVYRLQEGQPTYTAPAHGADQNRCVGVYLADGLYNARVELVPVVERARVGWVEVLPVPDLQQATRAVRLTHQIVADHNRVVAVAFRGVAPHLDPGVLGVLFQPYVVVEQAGVAPIR